MEGKGLSARIGIEDADKTKKELADIGKAGEKALGDIAAATGPLNTSLARLSGVVTGVKNAITATKTAMAPVHENFGNLTDSVGRLSGSLSNVANNIFPHFKEVLALGTVASAAGLLSLVRGAVESEHQLSLNAAQIGVTEKALKAYGKIAQQTGAELDQFVAAASRFSNMLQKTADDAQTSILKIVQIAVGEAATTGIVIGEENRKAAGKIVTNISDVFKQVKEIAPTAWAVMGDEARKAFGTVDGLIQTISKRLLAGGEAAKQMREEMAKWNVNLPSATIFEALNRQMPNFTGELQKMGFALKDLIDPTTGKAKQFNEVFPVFLDKFAQIPDVSKQSRVALDLFGRAGLNMLPFLQQGSKFLAQYPEIFESIGVKADTSVKGIDKLKATFIALDASTRVVKKTIGLAFAEVFDPILQGVTKLVVDSVPMIKEWATGIANTAKPIVEDFIAVLVNADAQVKNQWVKDLVLGMREFFLQVAGAIPSLTSFFGLLNQIFGAIATAINSVLGTNLNAVAVGAIIVIGSMSGAFVALGAAFTVATTAGSLLYAVLSPLFILLAGAVGIPLAIATGIGLITAAFIDWKALPGQLADTWKAFWNMMGALFEAIENGWKNMWIAIAAWAEAKFAWVIDLANKAKSAWDSLFGGSAPGAVGGGLVVGSPAIMPGFARGGPVWGAGGHTSDRIRAYLSDGEFVMRWAAVRKYGLDFMHGLNSLRLPAAAPGFAMGGSAAQFRPTTVFDSPALGPVSALDRVAVDLTLPNGETFHDMLAPRAVAAKFGKFARQRSRVAIGRRPGWHSA